MRHIPSSSGSRPARAARRAPASEARRARTRPRSTAPPPLPSIRVNKDATSARCPRKRSHQFLMTLRRAVFNGRRRHRCMTCHGPEGKGTPGGVPPLVGQKDTWATAPTTPACDQRLTGAIKVDGTKSNNVMTPQGPLLNDLRCGRHDLRAQLVGTPTATVRPRRRERPPAEVESRVVTRGDMPVAVPVLASHLANRRRAFRPRGRIPPRGRAYEDLVPAGRREARPADRDHARAMLGPLSFALQQAPAGRGTSSRWRAGSWTPNTAAYFPVPAALARLAIDEGPPDTAGRSCATTSGGRTTPASVDAILDAATLLGSAVEPAERADWLERGIRTVRRSIRRRTSVRPVGRVGLGAPICSPHRAGARGVAGGPRRAPRTGAGAPGRRRGVAAGAPRAGSRTGGLARTSLEEALATAEQPPTARTSCRSWSGTCPSSTRRPANIVEARPSGAARRSRPAGSLHLAERVARALDAAARNRGAARGRTSRRSPATRCHRVGGFAGWPRPDHLPFSRRALAGMPDP